MISNELCKPLIKFGTGKRSEVTSHPNDRSFTSFIPLSGKRNGLQSATLRWKFTNGCRYRAVSKRKKSSRRAHRFWSMTTRKIPRARPARLASTQTVDPRRISVSLRRIRIRASRLWAIRKVALSLCHLARHFPKTQIHKVATVQRQRSDCLRSKHSYEQKRQRKIPSSVLEQRREKKSQLHYEYNFFRIHFFISNLNYTFNFKRLNMYVHNMLNERKKSNH